MAIDLIVQAREKRLTYGKNPLSLAAASIYISGIFENERRTQEEIAEISNIRPVTLRSRYKDIAKTLGFYEELRALVENYHNKDC
jgi:transcription initiation factor TFIIB